MAAAPTSGSPASAFPMNLLANRAPHSSAASSKNAFVASEAQIDQNQIQEKSIFSLDQKRPNRMLLEWALDGRGGQPQCLLPL